jgi:hypothetical protein
MDRLIHPDNEGAAGFVRPVRSGRERRDCAESDPICGKTRSHAPF